MTQEIKIGVNTQGAEQDLAQFGRDINKFIEQRAQAAGKAPKLLDLTEDKKALEELKSQLQEVINLNASLREPINQANGANRPRAPSQINLAGISQSPAMQAQFMEKLFTRLFSHHAAHSQSPINTGLTFEELTGRPAVVRPPGQPHPNQVNPRFEKGANAVGYLARRFAPVAGGAGAAAGQAASFGAQGYMGTGLGAFAGGGMAGLAAGAGIGLLGYGIYKGASALSSGVDQNKVEATDIDKFRRSINGTSESFDKLRLASREIGDAFHMTYEDSRKIIVDFSNMAKSYKNAVVQAGEGVGLARAVGVDESHGAGFMASLRHDRTLSEKTTDARLLAVQFSEALKRTGSTLNASDLMHSLMAFSSDASRRSMTTPNIEGYSGILSAMVGLGRPGLDVNNAAGIMGRADTAFQSGGQMGEASNTLQYMAMEGDKIGLLGVKMRQAAGMFATSSQALGDKDSAVNKYLGNGGLSKFSGNETGLEAVMRMFDANPNKTSRLLGIGNHFGLNPEQAATLYNLRDRGHLGDTMGLASRYKGLDIGKLSGSGYLTLADIAKQKGDLGGLAGVRDSLSARSDLSGDQRNQLAAMAGMKDPAKLQDALVKFTATLERERTPGEEIQRNAADTAKATSRMADPLVNVSTEYRNFLAALVEKLAPESESTKRVLEEHRQKDMAEKRDKYRSGALSADDRNKYYDTQRYIAARGPNPTRNLDELNKRQREEMGATSGDPRSKAESAITRSAEKAGINPAYMRGLALLETGLGSKTIKSGSDDSRNLFNIKGKTGFQALDKAEGSRDFYRTYGSYDESANDLASLLSRKYPSAAQAKTPREFAEGLKRGGYATDPKYVDKLVGAIGSSPVQIPSGNPESNAVSQKLSMQFSPISWSADVNVHSGSGYDQNVQTVRTSGVMKPQAMGAIPP